MYKRQSLPNVATVSYDYYLGCYLSGMFGALISKTGKLGYIGGLSLPPLNADANAIKAGATSANAAATLNAAFAGSFQDPAKGQEIATQMYQGGVDFIQTDSAATDAGIISARIVKSKVVPASGPASTPPCSTRSSPSIISTSCFVVRRLRMARRSPGSSRS